MLKEIDFEERTVGLIKTLVSTIDMLGQRIDILESRLDRIDKEAKDFIKRNNRTDIANG
jgi:hypothetical protein